MEIGIATEGRSPSSALVDAVRNVDGEVVIDDAGTLVDAGLDLVIVSGWSDVRTVAVADGEAPLLVVDRPRGLAPIDRGDIAAAIETIRNESATIRSHAVIAIETGGRTVPGVSQAMLMTRDPASISEYAIRWDRKKVCEYRADGVTIATPAGSGEYTRAAGGAMLAPSVDGLAVVPIAPYRTDPDHWVLDGVIDVAVTRDEGDVALFVDGSEIGTVAEGESVTMASEQKYDVYEVPESRSPFENRTG